MDPGQLSVQQGDLVVVWTSWIPSAYCPCAYCSCMAIELRQCSASTSTSKKLKDRDLGVKQSSCIVSSFKSQGKATRCSLDGSGLLHCKLYLGF